MLPFFHDLNKTLFHVKFNKSKLNRRSIWNLCEYSQKKTHIQMY